MCPGSGALLHCFLLWLWDLLLCVELQPHTSNGGGMVYPEASDPYKTFWKDMQAEPSQELTPGGYTGLY